MYYNLTEDQKVFYATSYSLLKAGYTSEEIVEFWSNDNEEEIEFILESLEYVDIDRKDPDFIELIDEGLFSWGARLIAPITNAIRGARTARQLSQLRRIAQMTNPTNAQRELAIKLSKTVDGGSGIKFAWRQKNHDAMADMVRRTAGTDDFLRTVRPGSGGSGTARGSASSRPTEVAAAAERQNQNLLRSLERSQSSSSVPTPAVKPPRNPIITKQNLKRGAKTAVGLGAATGIVLGSDKVTPFLKDVLDTNFPIKPDKSKVKTDKPQVETDKPRVETEKPRVETEKPQVETEKPQRLPVQNYEPPSRPTDSSRQNPPESQPQSRDYEQERNKRREAIRQYRRSISSPTPGVSRRGVTGSVNNSYEYVIDKLIAEGHASSIEEAEYVFKQLDEDFINSII